MRTDTRCDKAPSGWQCTREVGHEGPCAAERLNCYDLTREQWHAVCEVATDIHMKLIEVEPGEDAFDDESLILTQGLVPLVKRIIALERA